MKVDVPATKLRAVEFGEESRNVAVPLHLGAAGVEPGAVGRRCRVMVLVVIGQLGGPGMMSWSV